MRLGAGFVLTSSCLILLLATLGDAGLTDDADAYVGAAARYATWCSRVLGGDVSALRRDAVDRAWAFNHEHPPLAKLVMGGSWWLLHAKLRWLGNVAACRLGVALLTGGLVFILFLACWDHVGRLAALTAPLFLLTMPRFFFDAHVETLDAAAAATCTFALYAFFRGLRDARWAVLSPLCFGLALLTKVNAPFLVVPFAGFLAVRWFEGRRGPELRRGLASLVAMGAVGPILFVALWPWLWFDTFARLSEYLRFHLHHYGILFLYLGHIYESEPAPWHAPFVMTAITTPPLTLSLAFGGALAALRRGPVAGSGVEERRDLGLLVLLGAVSAIGAVAFTGAPKYGGVKLFLPLFPLLALLAGWGLQSGIEAAGAYLPKLDRNGVRSSVAALALLPAGMDLAKAHPHELSYYNAIVGRLPGAVRLGCESQYYDLLDVELIQWMNVSLPEGTTVTFLPNNKEYVRNSPWLFRDGRIRPDLRFVELRQADVLVFTHEPRWPEYAALRERYKGLPVLWELRLQGVPLLTVYRLGSDEASG